MVYHIVVDSIVSSNIESFPYESLKFKPLCLDAAFWRNSVPNHQVAEGSS